MFLAWLAHAGRPRGRPAHQSRGCKAACVANGEMRVTCPSGHQTGRCKAACAQTQLCVWPKGPVWQSGRCVRHACAVIRLGDASLPVREPNSAFGSCFAVRPPHLSAGPASGKGSNGAGAASGNDASDRIIRLGPEGLLACEPNFAFGSCFVRWPSNCQQPRLMISLMAHGSLWAFCPCPRARTALSAEIDGGPGPSWRGRSPDVSCCMLLPVSQGWCAWGGLFFSCVT